MNFEDIKKVDGEIDILAVEFPVRYKLLLPLGPSRNIEYLEFREPTIFDTEVAETKSKSNQKQSEDERNKLYARHLIADLCGVSPEEIHKMGTRDSRIINEFIVNFL